jgi:hypothetical protein
MEIVDYNKKRLLDNFARLVFEELDPLLNDDLWYDHYQPLHDTFLRFLWDHYEVFCCPVFTRILIHKI